MNTISRKNFMKSAAAASAALALAPSAGLTARPVGREEGKHPNLVFVFPDEFRRQAIGFMNQDPVITPNLDRFCSQSLVLTEATSTFPLCSPFRAMLLTGRYPQANGVLTNCYSKSEVMLKESERCISDVFHDCGYSQGYIGKWHLDKPHEPYVGIDRGESGFWDEYVPPERRHGFDFWYAYNCRDTHFNPWYWSTDAGRNEAREVSEWSTKHEAEVAIEYIKNSGGQYRDPDRPFALFVSHNPPHMPFRLVPQQYVDMYGGKTYRDLLNRPNVDLDNPHPVAKEHVRNYFAAVTGTDDQFGRILTCLREEGLEQDTIVVFSSDHGEMMGSHNRMYKNIYYEESVGVPFIIRWPGKIHPGRDDLLLGTPDIMPSLLGLTGLSDRIPLAVEGRDYSAAMLGEECKRPTSSYYIVSDPVKPGQKLGEGGQRGIRTSSHTFVVTQETDNTESYVLFDNRKDPYQLENIAEKSPPLVRELTEELDGWLERTNDPWLRQRGS
ncbi:MAG TPA: sulfatase [archaeon]|nr:sulfatase [archaeon]